MNQKRYSSFAVSFLVLLLGLPSGPIAAQPAGANVAETQSTAHPETKVRTVIKNVSFVDAKIFEDVLSILPLTVVIKRDMNTIVLRGPSAPLETALAIIDNMDIPALPNPMIELRGYILAVSRDGQGVQVPDHLKPVTQELRDLFGFTSYQLVDTVFLRSSNGSGAAVGGSARLESKKVEVSYHLGFNRGWIRNFDRSRESSKNGEEVRHVVRLSGLALRNLAGGEPVMSTDIEIFEGQTAVIGKARLDDSLGDLILVVEAKVLDGGVS